MDRVVYFRVERTGLPDERDWNLAPAEDLYHSVPDIVMYFLDNFKGKNKLISKTRQLLSLP